MDNSTATSASTNADGRVTFSDLPAGTYTLTETKQNGYEPAGPWTITVGTESGADKNTLVKVQAPSTDNVFRNFWNWLVNTTAGGSTITNGELAISNTRNTGTAEISDTITITKRDQYQNLIPDVVFALMKGSEEIATATTDANGVATFTFGTGTDMVFSTGELILVEKSAPSGYTKTNEQWTVTVSATAGAPAVDTARDAWIVTTTYDAVITGATDDDALSVTNTKNEGTAEVPDTITITKRDQYQNLIPGVVFALMNGNEEIATATTDANGVATFTFGTGTDMVFTTGTLTLVEKSAPDGYTKTDEKWTVNVSKSNATEIKDDVFVTTTTYDAVITGATDDTLSVTNTRNSYKVVVTKTVELGDKTTLSGLPSGFQISYSSAETGEAGVLTAANAKTGTNTPKGPYTWEVELPYGRTFTFTETNYSVDSYDVETKVNDQENTTSGSLTVATSGNQVDFVNKYTQKYDANSDEIKPTTLRIHKTGDFQGTVKNLSGVTFTLKTAAGAVVASGTTDNDGIVELVINSNYLGKLCQ